MGCGSRLALLAQTVVEDVPRPSYVTNSPSPMLTTELMSEIQMEAQTVLMSVLEMAKCQLLVLDPPPSLINSHLLESSQNMLTINCEHPLPLIVPTVKTKQLLEVDHQLFAASEAGPFLAQICKPCVARLC